MESFELNSFDQIMITLIKTHLLFTAMCCTFFLCSVLIGKSFQFAFLRGTDDASKRTTTGAEAVAAQGKTDSTAGTAEAVQACRPAEPKERFEVHRYGI